MKFIQTLYFNKSIDPLKYSFGWVAPEYHLIGWALSCLQLHQLYKNVDLYCNSNGALLLKDKLGLPYSNIYITHDDFDIVNEQLWALPKILTYSLQNEPFLHLDGDVFLFKELPAPLLRNELIAQNIEIAKEYYLPVQKELIKYFTYFPNCVTEEFNCTNPIRAVNAGILGGSNIEFIKEYTDLAFKYITRNARHLSSINAEGFNVFFEQHLFYSLAKEKGLPIEFLIKDIIVDNRYQHLGDFHEVPCKTNYLHLLGAYKKDEFNCRQMAAKLRQLYPEYYYRIISLCKNEFTPLSISFYTDKKFNSESDYVQFKEKSKESFSLALCTGDTIVSNNTSSSILKEQEITVLALLKKIANNEMTGLNNFAKSEIEKDLVEFSKNISELLVYNNNFPNDYIYGRDLEAASWFCELFGNDLDIPNKMVSKCDGISIIKSRFDWGGLLNKIKRKGIYFYQILEFEQGDFYNLVIPEIFGDGFSLQDLDEMEKIILDNLSEPSSVKELFAKMHIYAEEDIINNHLDEYEQLFMVMLKHLVLKKAVKPLKALI